MRLIVALVLLTSTLALAPVADACSGANCVPDKTICVRTADACVNPRDTAEDALRVFEPCTCPPR